MIAKLKIAALVLFAIADVALLVVLFQHTRDVRFHDPSQTTSTAGTATSTPSPVSAKPTGSRSLLMAPNGSLVRITRGSCTANGRPFLEYSSNLGKSFKEIGLPLLKNADATDPNSRAVTVKTILQVHIKSKSEFDVVASDEKCKAHGYSTTDSGNTWSKAKSITQWYINAAGDEVVSPTNTSQPGCDVVSLSPFSDRNAKVACDNGSIRGTDDDGHTWVVLGKLDGVVSATFLDLRRGFAVGSSSDCKARAYVTIDAGLTWTPAGCVGKDAAQSLAGTSPERITVLTSSGMRVSTDNAVTWKAPQ